MKKAVLVVIILLVLTIWWPLFKPGFIMNSDFMSFYYMYWATKNELSQLHLRGYDAYSMNGYALFFVLHGTFSFIFSSVLGMVLPELFAIKLAIFIELVSVPVFFYLLMKELKFPDNSSFIVACFSIVFTNISYIARYLNWFRNAFAVGFFVLFVLSYTAYIENKDKKRFFIALLASNAVILCSMALVFLVALFPLCYILLQKKSLKEAVKFYVPFILLGCFFTAPMVFYRDLLNFHAGSDMGLAESFTDLVKRIPVLSWIGLVLCFLLKDKKIRNIYLSLFLPVFVYIIFSRFSIEKAAEPLATITQTMAVAIICKICKVNKVFIVCSVIVLALLFVQNSIFVSNTIKTEKSFPELIKASDNIFEIIKQTEHNSRTLYSDLALIYYGLPEHKEISDKFSNTHFFSSAPVKTGMPSTGSMISWYYPKAKGEYINTFESVSLTDWYPLTVYNCSLLKNYMYSVNAKYFVTYHDIKCDNIEKIYGEAIKEPAEISLNVYTFNEYVPSYFAFAGNLISEHNNIEKKQFKAIADIKYESKVYLKMNYFPNWKVKVDNNEAETNLCWFYDIFPYMCTIVPAGQHEILFYYDNYTPLDILLLIVSLGAFLALYANAYY